MTSPVKTCHNGPQYIAGKRSWHWTKPPSNEWMRLVTSETHGLVFFSSVANSSQLRAFKSWWRCCLCRWRSSYVDWAFSPNETRKEQTLMLRCEKKSRGQGHGALLKNHITHLFWILPIPRLIPPILQHWVTLSWLLSQIHLLCLNAFLKICF